MEKSFVQHTEEKTQIGLNLVGDVDLRGSFPDAPKEIRNWRIYLYCIGVCFGSVALGMPAISYNSS